MNYQKYRYGDFVIKNSGWRQLCGSTAETCGSLTKRYFTKKINNLWSCVKEFLNP